MDINSLGKKLKFLRNLCGKTQKTVASEINIEQGTYANYENGLRIPKTDILIQLADYYHVPLDFLVGINMFANWEGILRHKDDVLDLISNRMKSLSIDLKTGTDDITFIKLVYAFNVFIEEREDGFGIDAKDPIPSYSDSLFSQQQHRRMVPQNSRNDQNASDQKFLSIFRSLDEVNRDIVIGDMQKYLKEQHHDTSVAAGEPMKKVSGK